MKLKSYNVTLSTGETYHITLTDERSNILNFEKWLRHDSGTLDILDGERLDIKEWRPGLWLNRKYIVCVVACNGFDEENCKVTD